MRPFLHNCPDMCSISGYVWFAAYCGVSWLSFPELGGHAAIGFYVPIA